MIKNERGASYISVIFAVVVIAIFSGVLLNVVSTTNEAINLSSKNNISSQIADSFLNLAESKLTSEEMINDLAHRQRTYDNLHARVDEFNAQNKRFTADVFFNCLNNCVGMNNDEISKKDYVPSDDYVEVIITVSYKKEEKVKSFHRLVVVSQ